MKIRTNRHPAEDKDEIIITIENNEEHYAFSNYPPKYDSKFKNRLPDANQTPCTMLRLAYFDNEYKVGGDYIIHDFRKIYLCYKTTNGTIIYCQDWEQVYDNNTKRIQ